MRTAVEEQTGGRSASLGVLGAREVPALRRRRLESPGTSCAAPRPWRWRVRSRTPPDRVVVPLPRPALGARRLSRGRCLVRRRRVERAHDPPRLIPEAQIRPVAELQIQASRAPGGSPGACPADPCAGTGTPSRGRGSLGQGRPVPRLVAPPGRRSRPLLPPLTAPCHVGAESPTRGRSRRVHSATGCARRGDRGVAGRGPDASHVRGRPLRLPRRGVAIPMERQPTPRLSPGTEHERSRECGGGRVAILILQDKAVPHLSRNSRSSSDKRCGTAFRQCGRFAARRRPVIAALISAVSAVAGSSLNAGFTSLETPKLLRVSAPGAVARDPGLGD